MEAGAFAGELLPRLLPVAAAWALHCPETARLLFLPPAEDWGWTLLGKLRGRTVPWVQRGHGGEDGSWDCLLSVFS